MDKFPPMSRRYVRMMVTVNTTGVVILLCAACTILFMALTGRSPEGARPFRIFGGLVFFAVLLVHRIESLQENDAIMKAIRELKEEMNSTEQRSALDSE